MINPSSRGISERRRQSVDRIDAMTTKDTTVSGRTLVRGVGEVTVDIKFPVAFGQRPNFSFGGELDTKDPAQPTIGGSFPQVSAVVIAWTTVKRIPGAFDGYFTGCMIAIVTQGFTGQDMWVHWSFHAPAIRNPVAYEDGIDEVL